jgi:ABC-type cobalamin/Fe3+-siderophores transport system ATPase subunit
MRKVEVARRWEKLRARKSHAASISAVHLKGLSGFIDGSIPIKAPIYAFCGQNGSGKTLLLRSILGALKWSEVAGRELPTERFVGATIELEVQTRTTSQKVVLDYSSKTAPDITPSELEVVFLDGGQEIPRLQRYFQQSQELEEEIAAYASRALRSDEVNFLSYVAQKQYDAITVYEIDDIDRVEGFPLGTIPYFELLEEKSPYDSRSASLGELSILYIYFKMTSAPTGSVVLIEEPETFLSEFSQSELIDMIASIALDRDLTVIMTTHSPRISRNLTDDESCYLLRSHQGVKVALREARTDLKQTLGYANPLSKILFFEDHFARSVFEVLCEKVNPSTFNVVEMAGKGGAEALKRVRAALPADLSHVRLAYVFDGDMRKEKSLDAPEVAFLPSDVRPERLFRSYVRQNAGVVSTKLGLTSDSLELRMTQLNGRNDHDWVPELATSCGVTLQTFLRLVVDCWIADDDNRKEVDLLFERLKLHLFPARPAA